MFEKRRGLVIGITLLLLTATLGTFAALTLSLPTATNFGVGDTSGYKNTHVLIPVNITNVQNGPVPCIKFDVLYDNRVLNVTDVQRGTLTSDWDIPAYFNHDWGTRVAIVYNPVDADPIQNGSTGSVVLLNFSVIGVSGDTSWMDFANIQLAEGYPNYQIGTAPANNGTFTLLTQSGTINGQVTDVKGAGLRTVTVTLTTRDSGVVVETTTTDKQGYFCLTNVAPSDYYLNCTKHNFYDVSVMLTLQPGETKTENIILPRKGKPKR